MADILEKNPGLQAKLEQARKKYPGSFRDLADIEIKLRREVKEAEIINIPAVQLLITDAKERCVEISQLLAFDKSMNEDVTNDSRRALFQEREAHLFWLNRFDLDPVDEIVRRLEGYLDEKLST